MTDPRTVSTTIAGEPCRVTSPLLRQEAAAVYACAADKTLMQLDTKRYCFFVVKCDNQAQLRYIEARMAERPELFAIKSLDFEPQDDSRHHYRIIPFRLLPRRWLLDWRETADRVEVREGASGSVYMTAVIAGEKVAEKRIPMSCACDAATEIARLRAQHPSLALFDFRPVKGSSE